MTKKLRPYKASEIVSGLLIGRLTVIKQIESLPKKGRVFECLCSCGNVKNIPVFQLASGTVNSCGCLAEYASLLNKRYDKLLVIEELKSKRNRKAWNCLCDCGNTIILETSQLIKNNNTSCGCKRKKPGNIIGQKFGKLTVIEKLGSKWICKCLCGNITKTPVTAHALLSGKVQSCGCLLKDFWRQYRLAKGKNPDESLQEFTRQLRDKVKKLYPIILNRDDYKCVLCNEKQHLEIHHIIPICDDDTLALKLTNLITLCEDCHKLAHLTNWKYVDKNIQFILQQHI